MWWKTLAFGVNFLLMILLILPSFTSAQSNNGNDLPLLEDGQAIGLVYADTVPEAKEILDSAYGEMLNAGLNGIALAFFWEDLEPTPGEYDTNLLETYLELTELFEMNVYIVIRTVDTVTVHAPSDLVDPNSATGFKNGLHFDSPEVLTRFQAMLDVTLPLLENKQVFFISVGNEIDGWLNAHPTEIEPFTAFVASNRTYIQAQNPAMGVGATLMFGAVERGDAWLVDILAVSDAAVLTYYPLNDDFTVREPNVVADDFALMVEFAGNKPILLQEVGYPSGYTDHPGNHSSGAKQAQFVTNIFTELSNYPQIRFLSFLQMADWVDAECDGFLGYYGLDAPRFREYLCSLGIRETTGEAKPAYDAFLQGLLNFQ